jgi:hypothetical protein
LTRPRSFATGVSRFDNLRQRKKEMTNRLSGESASHIEFAAAHEETAKGIRADETAIVVNQFRTANRTKFPPIVHFWVGRGIGIPTGPNFLHYGYL